ncbi:MAG: dienelactone hydrolase family protein [Holosporaceae bacterium]|nr:dienelactone hydrolase family protein [Holosporaceae bacterium]
MDEIILEAKSESEGGKVVFLFHGYGADKNDLRPIGERISKAFPEAEIHIPNGIERCNAGIGRQWFALEDEDVNLWKDAFVKNAADIKAYTDAVISKKKSTYKDVIFMGFSQGAMLSLSLGLKYKAKAVVAFSGLLLEPEVENGDGDTKVLLTHGGKDNVIPFDTMRLTEEVLIKKGIYVEAAISPALTHGIDNYLLDQAIDFLKRL